MTTTKEFLSCECLTRRAADAGFTVTPGIDWFCLTPVGERWPALLEAPIRTWHTAEEACAWLDGVAWAQFMERAKEKA